MNPSARTWVVRTESKTPFWVAHWEGGAVLESPFEHDAECFSEAVANVVALSLSQIMTEAYIAEPAR